MRRTYHVNWHKIEYLIVYIIYWRWHRSENEDSVSFFIFGRNFHDCTGNQPYCIRYHERIYAHRSGTGRNARKSARKNGSQIRPPEAIRNRYSHRPGQNPNWQLSTLTYINIIRTLYFAVNPFNWLRKTS